MLVAVGASTGSGTAPAASYSTPRWIEQRGVAAVVEDHVRALAVRPRQRLLGAPPVLLERLALPGEDRDAGLGDRRGGVILRREDVARRPADLGAESDERLDQHGGLDRHVQRAGDARALERLRVGELGARRHQAGHLVLGELDLLAAIGGQADVGDLVVGRRDGGHTVSRVGVVCGAQRGEQALVLLLLEAQPVGRRHVGGALRLGVQPGVGRLAQLALAAQPQGEREIGQPDVVLVQQLAQGAQALQLGGSVQAVAGGRARGLHEPDALHVAQHARAPARGLSRLVDRQRVHLDASVARP